MYYKENASLNLVALLQSHKWSKKDILHFKFKNFGELFCSLQHGLKKHKFNIKKKLRNVTNCISKIQVQNTAQGNKNWVSDLGYD